MWKGYYTALGYVLDIRLVTVVYIHNYYNILTLAGPHSGTAESIFTKMNSVLQSNHIPWANCVGVGVDNTSLNLGRSNSIMTRVLQQNPATYFMSCPCHIAHNMAMKASGSFTVVSTLLCNKC